MKHPVLRKGFNPPSFVYCNEGYALFHFLITGEPLRKQYFDQRHKWIHDAIENMYQNAWTNKSIDNLIYALNERWDGGELERAGGETYIRKLLGNFDPENDLEAI